MKARIWGCRGSLSTPGASTIRYGGNTSCVEVRTPAGALIVLDAGTGIRNLGAAVAPEGLTELDLVLTHLHLDHIEGLGFFAPLFNPECVVRVWGPRPVDGTLHDLIAAYLSPPYFPVPFEHIPAQISITEVGDESWEIGGLRIQAATVKHPGTTLGYRLSQNGTSLAYIPDNEPGLQPESGLALAGGADVLLHDAQYTDDEYASRVGWGHSAISHFVTYLAEAAPGRAVMFHHDPSHADAKLDEMLAEVRRQTGHGLIELAHEGLELDLGSAPE
jgi:phosphoribosyl 1,2-cyclic phosphodiesterase